MASSARTRVLLVDANVALREIVAELLADEPDFAVAGCAGSAEQGLAALAAGGVDLVLISDHLPDVAGSAALPRVREAHPDVLTALWTSAPAAPLADVCVHRGSTYRDLVSALRRAVRSARRVIELDVRPEVPSTSPAPLSG
ncbi:MAG TPA: response regulator [Mycobacteriales bacterium]|nr:response regulator [Mycobacteriales bacterium]